MWPVPAAAQSMPTRTLVRIKMATVRVVAPPGGAEPGGAGVVVKLEKNTAYVVTAAECVAGRGDSKGASEDAERAPPKIVVTPADSEERLAATLVGVDEARGLALLNFEVGKTLVGPLDPAAVPVRLIETMSVYSFGFAAEGDAGKIVAAVKRTSVISLRRSAPDNDGWIRVDGVPGEGYVGGPVVDASGRLVGVSRACGPDDKESSLTARGDVVAFVEAGLKGKFPAIARKEAMAPKVVVKEQPEPIEKAGVKDLPGGVQLVQARWGVLVESGDTLLDSVDVLASTAKLLEEGRAVDIESRVFPARVSRRALALHCSLQAGDRVVELQLPLRSQVRLADPTEALAAREETVFVDAATWSVDRTFNPDFAEESRDVTALFREKVQTLIGCRISVLDLPELKFGHPKALTARIKLGKKQLEVRVVEPGLIRFDVAKP
jgi:hypothetical protein